MKINHKRQRITNRITSTTTFSFLNGLRVSKSRFKRTKPNPQPEESRYGNTVERAEEPEIEQSLWPSGRQLGSSVHRRSGEDEGKSEDSFSADSGTPSLEPASDASSDDHDEGHSLPSSLSSGDDNNDNENENDNNDNENENDNDDNENENDNNDTAFAIDNIENRRRPSSKRPRIRPRPRSKRPRTVFNIDDIKIIAPPEIPNEPLPRSDGNDGDKEDDNNNIAVTNIDKDRSNESDDKIIAPPEFPNEPLPRSDGNDGDKEEDNNNIAVTNIDKDRSNESDDKIIAPPEFPNEPLPRSEGNDSDKEDDNNGITAPNIDKDRGNESDDNDSAATVEYESGRRRLSRLTQIQDFGSDTELQFVPRGTTRDRINATFNNDATAIINNNNEDDTPALSNEVDINNEDGGLPPPSLDIPFFDNNNNDATATINNNNEDDIPALSNEVDIDNEDDTPALSNEEDIDNDATATINNNNETAVTLNENENDNDTAVTIECFNKSFRFPSWERLPKEQFLANISQYCRFEHILGQEDITEEETDKIQRLKAELIQRGSELYDDENCLLWKSLPFQPIRGKSSESFVYVAYKRPDDDDGEDEDENHNEDNDVDLSSLEKKIGMAIFGVIRIKDQKEKLMCAAILMTLLQAIEVLGIAYIERVKILKLYSLNCHTDHDSDTRMIALQSVEIFYAAAYLINFNGVVGEKLTQLPTKKIKDTIRLDRMLAAHQHLQGNSEPPEILSTLLPAVPFLANINDGGVLGLFTWRTLTSYNQNRRHESEFLEARSNPILPEGGYLTQYLHKLRNGSKYEYGNYMDAIPTPPRYTYIEEVISELNPLLLANVENLDHEAIRNALDPLRKVTGKYGSYMYPTSLELAEGTASLFEQLDQDQYLDPQFQLIDIQTTAFEAMEKYFPEWLELYLPEIQWIGMSGFAVTETGIKVRIHPPHFEMLSHEHEFNHEPIYKYAKDFCVHLDLMILSGNMSFEEAYPIRLLLQSYLMNLYWGDYPNVPSTSGRTSFHYARNNFMPQGWFKSLPGNCRVISKPLGIHEQDFLHLREELGEECTKKLLIAHKLLCSGKQSKAPCEPDWICTGALPIEELGLEERRCVCEDWDFDEDTRRRPCLVKGDWPLAGSFACGPCLQKVFDRYECKYLKHLVENGTELNEIQQDRLEVHQSSNDRHCRETAKSLKKRYERGGKPAVEDQQMKDLLKQKKRASDPKILEARATAERNRQDGKPYRKSTKPKRYKKNCRYDEDTRKLLSTIALLCIKHCGHDHLAKNSFIRLSDILIQKRWNDLPQWTKDFIVGLDEENIPRHYPQDIHRWIDFFSFKKEGAKATQYFVNSVQTISNETVDILPDEQARTAALAWRSSMQATAKMDRLSDKPFPVLCNYLFELLFDPTEEVELKQTAENLQWWW